MYTIKYNNYIYILFKNSFSKIRKVMSACHVAVSQDFSAFFISWIKPIWAHDKQAKIVLLKNSFFTEIFTKNLTPHRLTPGLGTPFFSVRYVTFFYVLKKERYVLFRSFLEFLATYGTQKNVTFFSVLF